MITLGVDVGSLTGKALVLEEDEIVAWDIVLTGPDRVEAARTVTDNTLRKAGLTLEQVHRVVTVRATWGNPDEAVAILTAAIEVLQQEAPAYFGRLGLEQPQITLFDGPSVIPVPPSLTERLDLPVRLLLALSQILRIGSGGFTRLPPSSGSMITTARPFDAAYCKPLVPAWFSMSI